MTRYALVIGIAQYDSSLGSLTKPTNDAEAVASILAQPGYGDWEVKRLPEGWNREKNCYEVARERLNGSDLGQMLQDFILQQADRKDALIYFSGHGFTVSDNLGKKKGYLATSDCTSNAIATRGIALDSLNQLILESNLSSLVVLLDCCHAGSILESNLVRQSLTAFNSSQKDYYLIAACRGSESAWEGEEYSVFTEALLQGLREENAGSDGQVSCDRVFDIIATELKRSGQEPIRMGWGRSINLVKYQSKVAPRPTVVSEECPYQGLRYFDEKTAQFFFGRDKVVEILKQKLEQAAFVPVIGASGSGKSSVVRAKLIPALKNNGWGILDPIFPGVEPLAELKGAFNKQFERREIQEISHLIDTDGLRPVIERLPGSERWLLVVDQFEEVFTICSQQEERRRFIELLTQVAEIPASRLVIVTTMRADFLEPCLSYKSLTQLIQEWAVLIPPLVGAELEEAIASPAKLQGYHLETGLLGAILDDVGKEKDCLPLLQFALTELWEKRDNQEHQLTIEQYQMLGGVTGALNRHAEKVYTYKDFFKESPQQERTPQEQELIERIFLQLVRTGAGDKDTRQRKPKANLLGIAEDNSEEQQTISNLLEELINPGRLLVGDRQENQQKQAWVDLAHEALIEGWERFAKWREKDRDLRRLIDRLNDARQEWLNRGQEDNYLIMGGLLAEVRQNWEKIEPYLLDAAKAFYQQSDAHEQDRIAELQQALTESQLRERATRVQNLLPVKPLDGLVLAVESIGLNLAQLPGEILSSVQDSLHRAMEIAREENFLQGHEDYVYSVAISPDGQYIVSGSRDKTLRLWDIQGNLIGQPFQGHENAVMSVAFSPDGPSLVVKTRQCDCGTPWAASLVNLSKDMRIVSFQLLLAPMGRQSLVAAVMRQCGYGTSMVTPLVNLSRNTRNLSYQSLLARMGRQSSVAVMIRQCGCGTEMAILSVIPSQDIPLLSCQSLLAQMGNTSSAAVLIKHCDCGIERAILLVNPFEGITIWLGQSLLARMGSTLSVEVMIKHCDCGIERAIPLVKPSEGMKIRSGQSLLARMGSTLSVEVMIKHCDCGTPKAIPLVNPSEGMKIRSGQSVLDPMGITLSVAVLTRQYGCGTPWVTPLVNPSEGMRAMSIQSRLARMGKRLSVAVMTRRCGCGDAVGGLGFKSAVTDCVTIPRSKILKLKLKKPPAKRAKNMFGTRMCSR
jgi:Caspase domain/WD domain, G-beta repeat